MTSSLKNALAWLIEFENVNGSSEITGNPEVSMNFDISAASSVPRSWPITIKPFPVTAKDFALSCAFFGGLMCSPVSQSFERFESFGRSGSSNWIFKWVGPFPNSKLIPETKSKAGIFGNMPTWSVVWFAPVLRKRSGRSAVIAINLLVACQASRSAGWKLAAAVPLVQITATCRSVALEIPSA